MEILKRKGAKKILVCQMARKDWKKRYTYTLRGKAKKNKEGFNICGRFSFFPRSTKFFTKSHLEVQ